jgi:hypothetical protein
MEKYPRGHEKQLGPPKPAAQMAWQLPSWQDPGLLVMVVVQAMPSGDTTGSPHLPVAASHVPGARQSSLSGQVLLAHKSAGNMKQAHNTSMVCMETSDLYNFMECAQIGSGHDIRGLTA